MKVTMLLADSVQVVGGKLYILGGGWSIVGPQPTPSAIALLIEVPWADANRKHTAVITLVDGDGNPFLVDTPQGKEGFRIQAEFEVGRPPGVKPGVSLSVPLAINIGPLPLLPDTAYQWRLSIDDKSDADWSLFFYTRPATPPQMIDS